MRILRVVLAAGCLGFVAPAFAKDHPCKSFEDTCKEDPSVSSTSGKEKNKAWHECVSKAAEADAENGKACLDAMAKHKHHTHPM